MKIAITGATGHIGANIIPALLEEGHLLRALCRTPEKLQALGDLDIEVIKGDILDQNILDKTFEGMDAVIHLAGKITIAGDPDGSVMKTNVQGTANVVAACLKNNVGRLIHFSSVHAFKYSNKTPLVNEKSPYADQNSFIYDQSKAGGEQEVLKGIEKGLKATILNPTGVIGPHDYWHSRSGDMINDLFEGKLPALLQGGFDWVDVRDLVEATRFVLANGSASPRYLLSGHWVSFKELGTICQKVSGQRPPVLNLPIWIAIMGLPFIRLAQTFTNAQPLYTYESLMIIKNSSRHYSSQLARDELNYSPRPLDKSIEDIYFWRKEGL